MEKIPIQFGIITRDFNCTRNRLISLKGSPIKVGNNFTCWVNNLTSLEGGPEIVGDNYKCYDNELISLKGSPKLINVNFYCYNNDLQSLEGGPEIVEISYDCSCNKLISLEGSPSYQEYFNCSYNPIYEICKVFMYNGKYYKRIKDSMDYNYLRGTNIIKLRFQEACEEAGIKMPMESIPGYRYI